MKRALLFSLLMLFTASFAFDATEYLSANETSASVSKEYFNISNTVYYIVNISGKPTFLVKADALLENKADIEAALKSYYTIKYYPASSDIDKLKGYFTSLNTSRNDGSTRFPKKEEYACRQAIFLDKEPCYDNSSCYNTSRLFCAYLYLVGLGCNNPYIYYYDIESFSFASSGMDTTLGDVMLKLNGMNENNIVTYISQLKTTSISALKNYTSNIESTIFRYPQPGEDCPTCSGFCPYIDLNNTALTSAETLTNTISTKISPLGQYVTLAEQIYNNTQFRFQERNNAAKRQSYLVEYNPLKADAKAVKNKTQGALSIVDNSTVKEKLAKLGSMETEIEAMINANNFTSVNSSLDSYSKAIASLNASADSLLQIYGNVSAAYETASVYMFLAESRNFGPDDTRNLNNLKQKKLSLDANFTKGSAMTSTQYSDMKAQYLLLADEEKTLLGKNSGERVLYIFTGMSNKFVDALDSMISAIGSVRPLTYTERTQISAYLPIGLSALLFVSFSSAVLFLFLVYYAAAPRPMHKALLVGISLFLIFLLALVSISVFLSINKSLNKLEFSDFEEMLQYSRNSVIVIQTQGATNEVSAAMAACASEISEALANEKISSSIYVLDGQACTVNGTAAQNCLDSVRSPIIMLKSGSEDSEYSGLLIRQATISGNAQSYDICPFAKAFSLQ